MPSGPWQQRGLAIKGVWEGSPEEVIRGFKDGKKSAKAEKLEGRERGHFRFCTEATEKLIWNCKN